MKNKKVENIITAILAAAVLITGGMSLYSYLSEQKAKNEYDTIRQEAVVEESRVEETEEVQVKNYPDLQIDFANLKKTNPDFRGWLYFPALDISYPVVQGEDNNYYLKHSFEGESVNAGCIFMDCEASADWSDRNTFVFGHNMRDESMFGSFKNLLKGTVSCKEDPYFYIYTEDKVYIYEIFAYYETRSTSDRFATFTSDATYDDYVQWATEHSLYASDADLSDRGNIVSLSTCYGSAGRQRHNVPPGMIDTIIFQDKTAVYYTLGCKLNFSETSTIGKTLKEAGVCV